MSDQERQDLIDTANALGLEFPSNIPSVKLQAMVDEAQEELPSATPEPLNETPPPSPAMKPEETDDEKEAQAASATPLNKLSANVKRELLKRVRINKAKKAATKTSIVTLTNRDPRENDKVTTAHLTCENQYFSVSRIIPLDVAVELEECLIHIARSTTITLHKDDGTGTGNRMPVSVKKYAVSYDRRTPH